MLCGRMRRSKKVREHLKVTTISNSRNERHWDECSEGETVSPQQTVSKRERHSQTDLSSNQLEMSNLSTVLLHFIYKRTRAFSSRDGSSFPRGKELP